MKPQTIRFPDPTWDLIRREAEEAGVTAAAYVREAAMMRAIWSAARRGGPYIEGYEEVGEYVVSQMREKGLV
jgi:hypothetical protein